MTLAEKTRVFELPGGASLAVVRNPHAPTLSIIGALRAGLPGKEASSRIVPSVLSSMLKRGAGNRGRLELACELENHGLSLETAHSGSSPGSVLILMQGLAEEMPRMLSILSDVMRQPRLEAEELEKLRQQMLGVLRWERSDPGLRATGAFSRMLYGAEHPLHRLEISTRETELLKLDREDLLAFHSAVYGTHGLRLAVVGDVDATEVAELLGANLAGWQPGRLENPPCPSPIRSSEDIVRIEIADRPNLEVIMGHASSLLRSNIDYIPAQLANACLGQSTLTSRLGLAVRDKAGLTYGINSSFQAIDDVPGPWQINMGVSAEKLDQALELTRELCESYLAKGPRESEVDDERHAWAGSFRVAMATNSGVARQLLRQLLLGRPMEELDQLPERIMACSREACIEAMRQYLHPEKMVCAWAGSGLSSRE